jgi:carotenoid cleavage dioxygenase
LDPGKHRIEEAQIPGTVEFPSIDRRMVGNRYRQLYHAARLARADAGPGFDGIRRLDLETGEIDAFRYGDEFLVEEHIFVTDSSKEGAGWLIGTALDVARGQTVLSVFDAMHLADGTLAQARLPYALPLGLHGSFKAA